MTNSALQNEIHSHEWGEIEEILSEMAGTQTMLRDSVASRMYSHSSVVEEDRVEA